MMDSKLPKNVVICWFRRDLRVFDHAALYHALTSGHPVLSLFIFDKQILDDLSDVADKRVSYIHEAVCMLDHEFQKAGSGLYVVYGEPLEVFDRLKDQFSIEAVYTNEDYEPYARRRDAAIKARLSQHKIPFYQFKDQVIFAPEEILKDDGSPYLMYTPYAKKWLALLESTPLPSHNSQDFLHNVFVWNFPPVPSLDSFGFKKVAVDEGNIQVDAFFLHQYEDTRNQLDLPGSGVSVHLRFGKMSIRRLVAQAKNHSLIFLKELIWREFFMMILYRFPEVVNKNFNSAYDNFEWRNNEKEFEKWCRGETGYSIVDAGMRELLQTGLMHNRTRMIAASFLCKHLLIDWRWGEAYFAEKLLDYELSSNNGNWQWAAGTGTDAAPYFRIFNPEVQQQKFDPAFIYIKRWVPEYEPGYLPKVVDHSAARQRALHTYKQALGKQ